MISEKFEEIHRYCLEKADETVARKYDRYFKGGYKGYGVTTEDILAGAKKWLAEWTEMTYEDCLDLGDVIMREGGVEEKLIAIHLANGFTKDYSLQNFERLGAWLESGLDNWALVDTLSMHVMKKYMQKRIVAPGDLIPWAESGYSWKRRAVPYCLLSLTRKGGPPGDLLPVIELLMLDEEVNVQKAIGTFLRETWRRHPAEIEEFLLEWKDECARPIVQYATEKMDAEKKKMFKKG